MLRKPTQFRPILEPLEDRIVPAMVARPYGEWSPIYQESVVMQMEEPGMYLNALSIDPKYKPSPTLPGPNQTICQPALVVEMQPVRSDRASAVVTKFRASGVSRMHVVAEDPIELSKFNAGTHGNG